MINDDIGDIYRGLIVVIPAGFGFFPNFVYIIFMNFHQANICENVEKRVSNMSLAKFHSRFVWREEGRGGEERGRKGREGEGGRGKERERRGEGGGKREKGKGGRRGRGRKKGEGRGEGKGGRQLVK